MDGNTQRRSAVRKRSNRVHDAATQRCHQAVLQTPDRILTACKAFRGGFIVDHGDQLTHRFEAHFVVRKLQGGQRGLEHVRNERLVVDADHRHIGSDAHSAFSRGFVDEGRAHIVEAEDAVRLDLVEHATGFRSGVCSLFHIDDQLLVEGDARVRERSAIPGEPLPLGDNGD